MLLMSAEHPAPIQLGGQEWANNNLPVLKVVYPGDAVTVVGCCRTITEAEIATVCHQAAKDFDRFKHSTVQQRSQILQKLAGGIEAHAENLAKLITLETGKPIKLSAVEVDRAISVCQGYAQQLAVNENRVIQVEGREATIRRFPVGPVLAITPYNFPLNLVVHKLAPAIAAGCSLTVKPSSKSPLTALYLGKLCIEAGYQALQVVPAPTAVTEGLITSGSFKHISFTGGDTTGQRIAQLAGGTPTTMELGGNAACIIEDIPEGKLQTVARRVAQGAFQFAGQSCISVQRLLVNQQVQEAFTAALVQEARNMIVGNPLVAETDLGPMITPEDVFRVRNVIKETIAQGGNVLYGGNTYNALTMNPTILNRTTPEMAVNRTEMFAPLLTVTTYQDYEQALAQANDSDYGLQVGVYTQSWQKAQQAFELMDVGGVLHNDIPTTRLDVLPYGGVKASGHGREGVLCGVENFTTLKTFITDKQF